MTSSSPPPSSSLLVLPSTGIATTPLSLSPLVLPTPAPGSLPASQFHVLHPSTNTRAALALVELHRTAPRFGSFLLAPADGARAASCVRNGALTFVTPVDPLFAALHLAGASARSDSFQARADLLADSALVSLVPAEQLALVCEVRHVTGEEEPFFKLSRDKLVDWVRFKIHTACATDAARVLRRTDIIAWVLSYVPFPEWVAHLRTDPKASKGAANENSKEEEEEEQDAEQTQGDAASLAMSVMFADAQANGEPDYDFRASTADRDKDQKKKAAAKNKPVVKPSAAAVNFWAKQTTRSASKAKSSTKSVTPVKKSGSKKALGGKRKRT